MEPQLFPSRRSASLGAILWTPLLAGLVMSGLVRSWVAVVALAVTAMVVGTIWFGTVYEIRGRFLEIRIGPVRMPARDLASLRRVRRSRSLVAAPANSLDRLELEFGEGETLLVSPHRESLFLDELRALAPSARFEV